MSDFAADLAALLGGDTTTKTLAELITMVRFRGDFRNVKRFPDDGITIELQAAFYELYELIVNTNEGYFDAMDTVVTVASQAYVALPTGAWRIRGVDRLDGTDYVAMRQTGITERNRFGSQTGTPVAFIPTARGLDLYPTPDAVYTIRVVHTPVAPTLDTTPRGFYNGWEEYVVFGALVRLAGNEHSQSNEWRASLQEQRDRITRGASQRKAPEPEYLPLREGGGDWLDDPHPRWSW